MVLSKEYNGREIGCFGRESVINICLEMESLKGLYKEARKFDKLQSPEGKMSPIEFFLYNALEEFREMKPSKLTN